VDLRRGYAGWIYGAAIEAHTEYDKAKKEADQRLKDASCQSPAFQSQIKELLAQAQTALTRTDTAKTQVDAIIDRLPRDPPIDSISHSVNFVVAVSGNITPSWTLVNFKGPGSSGTFASATHTNTHTLSIALGSPAVIPIEQNRQLNNLVIIQTLGQQRPNQ
jgi:hypothetical protein